MLNFFSDDPNDLPGRWLAFARGFFHGYVYDTIYDHLVNHVFLDTITKGPREVRMVMAAKKVFATVDKMLDIVHTLEQELDDNAIQQGLNHFKGAAGKLAEGAAMLFSAIYYLPHDQAEPLLKMFGQNAAGQPPDPKLWAAEAQRQLGHVTALLGKLAHLKSAEEVLEELKSSKALKALMVVAVLEPQIIWGVEYAWHKHMPKGTGWPTFLFVALAGILYLDHVTDDKFAIVLSDLIVDLLRNFPGATAERAELVGKLIGDFYGGMVMNNTVWSEGDLDHGGKKKPSLLAKWRMSEPLSGSTVWGNVKWGPIDSILELLFNRYLFLFEKLKKVPGEVGKARDFIADSVQSMSDKKLDEEGWGHLKDFHDDSHKGLSMKQIGLAIVKLRKQLAVDLDSFLKHHHKDIEEYQNDIVAFNRLVEKSGFDFHVPANEKEAKFLYHQMLRHLYLALDSLAEALRLLFEPFTKSGFSWIRLLQELGLDVGDLSKLQDEVMKKAKDELQSFKKKP